MSTPKAPGEFLSKIGIHVAPQDRTKASSPEPSASPSQGSSRTQIFTYFTKPISISQPTAVLYNGDKLWATVVLTLETAGPVSVGQLANLTPVLSGPGQLLRTGVPTPFRIAKGNRLYIASSSVNRVAVVIEPIPWLEQITGLIMSVLSALSGRK